MKTSELIGPALDWAVAKCEGKDYEDYRIEEDGLLHAKFCGAWLSHTYTPSADWAIGGPIIEREKIKISPNLNDTWSAQIRHETSHPLVTHKVLAGWTNSSGPTMLVAAMRCLVRSKLGDEVEIPEELL